MLDRKMIKFGGKHDKIEVCDLFFPKPRGDGGELVHVKRGRSSANLSHLFAQGLVASSLLVREPDFVKSVNVQLKKQEFAALDTNFTAKGHTVVYAIIDGPAEKPLQLPFFSLVTLQNCGKSLAAYGFKVVIFHIPESAKYLARVAIENAKKKSTK